MGFKSLPQKNLTIMHAQSRVRTQNLWLSRERSLNISSKCSWVANEEYCHTWQGDATFKNVNIRRKIKRSPKHRHIRTKTNTTNKMKWKYEIYHLTNQKMLDYLLAFTMAYPPLLDLGDSIFIGRQNIHFQFISDMIILKLATWNLYFWLCHQAKRWWWK